MSGVTPEMLRAGFRSSVNRETGAGELRLADWQLERAYLAMKALDPEWVRMQEALVESAEIIRDYRDRLTAQGLAASADGVGTLIGQIDRLLAGQTGCVAPTHALIVSGDKVVCARCGKQMAPALSQAQAQKPDAYDPDWGLRGGGHD